MNNLLTFSYNSSIIIIELRKRGKQMNNLILLVFDLCLFAFYAIIGFIGFMLIQGITYWTTGFSIYNWLSKQLQK